MSEIIASTASNKKFSKEDILSGVLRGPIVSEKVSMNGENTVAFWVNPKSNKDQIKLAIETFFPNAKVAKVQTSTTHRTMTKFGQIDGRTKRAKKAYVTLAENTKIDLEEL